VIRVLLADDHGVIRDGLGRLIEALPDVELAGVAADGEQAVDRARALRPDVVLMDL
jgi:DNA-binding NarL/FixJ family response regulator